MHIAKVFCGLGIDWIHTNGVAMHLRGIDITISNQVWHAVICAMLMLVTRLPEVTKDRV